MLGSVRDNRPNFVDKQRHFIKTSLKGMNIAFSYTTSISSTKTTPLCRDQEFSTWDCEKGLRAFSTYCYSTLHSSLLDDTKLNGLGIHKIEPLPRDNAIENIADNSYMTRL